METRNVLGGGVVAVAMLALSPNAFAQQAVQWRVEDGGNGHWYQLITTRSTWDMANAAAVSVGGYLATLTSAAEHQFVRVYIAAHPQPLTYFACWFGGIQRRGESVANAGWEWVTGEPWNFTSWAGGEPNDYQGINEDRLENYFNNQGWNDNSMGNPVPFMVEFSADCNDDGIVDYGQILDGSVSDANGNGVPDGCECLGDLTGDRHIDGYDLSAVLANWGMAGSGKLNADVTGDGTVDFLDLAVVLGGWGACSP